MIRTNDDKQIQSELAQFTGTTRYYRSGLGGLLLTDGMHYVREELNAYWLAELVESYQPKLTNVPFQLWSLDKRHDESALIEAREDTGLDAIVSQWIPYTDFPLSKFDWYCIDRVLLLPSEY